MLLAQSTACSHTLAVPQLCYSLLYRLPKILRPPAPAFLHLKDIWEGFSPTLLFPTGQVGVLLAHLSGARQHESNEIPVYAAVL